MKENKIQNREIGEINLVRILGKDISGNKRLFAGLTGIQGISWTFANAICKSLKLEKKKKIHEVSESELKKIEGFVQNPKIPGFIKNRQKDLDEGTDKHLLGADLILRKEFDIKRLKKIKSYKGNRHALGLPVRGQKTRSNFRRNRKKSGAVGVKKK